MSEEKNVIGHKLFRIGSKRIQTLRIFVTKVILNTFGRLRSVVFKLSKCEMARQKLCRKSSFGHCTAENKDLETCPYLKAIGEIARLSVESVIKEKEKVSHESIR